MAFSLVTVAFALLAFTQCSDAIHTSLRTTRIDGTDEEDKEYTGAMAARLCSSDDTIDIAWTLTVGDSTCSCACDAAECMTASCEDGYDLEENEETEKMECVRYTSAGGQVIPGEVVPVTCGDGRMEDGDCVMPSVCTPPPNPGGDKIDLLPQIGCEECRYPLDCVPPARLVVEDDAAFCKTSASKGEVTSERENMPAKMSCPDGADPVEGVCRINDVDCPGTLTINPSAMACGPATDDYIGHMLVSVAAVMKELEEELGEPSKSRVTCETACQAVFAKFSECVKQNDKMKCVGRAAGSGRGIRAIGDLGARDKVKGMKWLKKLQKTKAKKLPCKDMFGSEYNFQGNWLEGVEKIEKLAAKNNLLLEGDYENQPVGSLDCRVSLCRKVDQYAARQISKPWTTYDRSLSQCRAQCKSQYPK